MIKFIDSDNNILVEYDSYISDDELKATRELLEYENNCIINIEMEYD